ncbi:MAG: S41 family peptidase [Solirubrobacteraceae bacterium]|nr:S41 family peptidase [Solirubrobacteraceae bacterium]
MLRRILIPVVSLLVVLLGGVWLGGHPDRLPGFARDAFVQDDTAVVGEALGVLERRYYRKVDPRVVQEAALRAAVESLGDQYSAYLSPKDLVRFNEVTDAKFEGIGVEVQKADAGLLIMKIYDESPAKKAGLARGDVIVKAGTKSLAGLATTAASTLIRGPGGSKVKLTIRRDKKTFERDVARAEVRVPVVETRYDAAAKVGVVRLSGFSTDAASEVKDGITAMQNRGAKSIVLDLRGNPGGLVSEAQKLASLFLDGGTIVTTRGRSVRTNTLEATDDPAFPKLPVAVLVDGGSASAAEIVTGALQDRGRAKVYGERTYGKGVFQEVIKLGEGGAMDITVGQYFTPKGRNLGGAGVTDGKDVSRGKGIAPDVKAVDDPKTASIDEAAQIAIDAVKP